MCHLDLPCWLYYGLAWTGLWVVLLVGWGLIWNRRKGK
jgi:hypothetical protein